jgi:hypothetical protein
MAGDAPPASLNPLQDALSQIRCDLLVGRAPRKTHVLVRIGVEIVEHLPDVLGQTRQQSINTHPCLQCARIDTPMLP